MTKYGAVSYTVQLGMSNISSVGRYWSSQTDILSVSLVTATHFNIGVPAVSSDLMGIVGYQDSSSGNDHQMTCPVVMDVQVTGTGS